MFRAIFRLPQPFSTLGLKGDDVSRILKANMVGELEEELQAMERPLLDGEAFEKLAPEARQEAAQQLSHPSRASFLTDFPTHRRLLERRSALGLIELELRAHENELALVVAPDSVGQALQSSGADWWSLFLGRHLQACIGKAEFIRFEGLDSKSAPPHSPTPVKDLAPPQDEKRNPWFRRLGIAVLLTPILMTGLILYFFYAWVGDIRNDYDELKSTVDVQKEQILEAIERGVKSSNDVMDLIDLARDWAAPQDSVPKP